MSTTLFGTAEAPTDARTFGEELQTSMSGVGLHITWFGNKKQVSKDQKVQAAETFDAESGFVSMSKKLLDTKDDAWKKLVEIRGLMNSTWKNESLPYPEPGIRLMKRDTIDSFTTRMARMRCDLKDAEREYDRRFHTRREASRIRLGNLYNPADYPDSIIGYFDVTWDFPNLDPPEYLRILSPDLYRQESERIRARFEESVVLAEQAFLGELHELVEHLLERLSGSEDGKPKIFRDTVVTNLNDFFDRFKKLNIGSSAELDQLVTDAERIVGNVDPRNLRTSEQTRAAVSRNLSRVQATLDGLMIDRPRRNLMRPNAASNRP